MAFLRVFVSKAPLSATTIILVAVEELLPRFEVISIYVETQCLATAVENDRCRKWMVATVTHSNQSKTVLL